MSDSAFVSTDYIRSLFSSALSEMYRKEVPLYGDLLEIVETINQRELERNRSLATDLARTGEIQRLSNERHGAIRLGTPEELNLMRRAFAVMGMYPVGYYDLSVAGVPVHSTAFRPVEDLALRANPFRIFTSLLRLELIEPPRLREQARAQLSGRRIFTEQLVDLIARADHKGGLDRLDSERFIAELLHTFEWHGDARVDSKTYEELNAAHALIADVVSFHGPHINHLTPRTLDIDAVQMEMLRRGIDAKELIEGPPRRTIPILLRQTSFKAIEEDVRFSDGRERGHTARFGEIEQRGIALTRKGRELYDRLLERALKAAASNGSYEKCLAAAFADFPDSLDDLRRSGLAFFRYVVTAAGREEVEKRGAPGGELEQWLENGYVEPQPIIYEDFLPVSAAGIFQSNLGNVGGQAYKASNAKSAFEDALGATTLNEFELYEAQVYWSTVEVRQQLGSATASAAFG